MTATSSLPCFATGEPRLAFGIDETTAALAISPALGHDPIRAGRVGSVMAGRLISRGHLDAVPAGDGA